jgi:hypothetical protein
MRPQDGRFPEPGLAGAASSARVRQSGASNKSRRPFSADRRGTDAPRYLARIVPLDDHLDVTAPAPPAAPRLAPSVPHPF